MRKSRLRLIGFLILAAVIGLAIVIVPYLWRFRGAIVHPSLPTFAPRPTYTPWPTPPVAESFGFPLLPAGSYGPYVQGVTGPLAVDTRYGAQNPAMGDNSNCFRDADGGEVPFSQLYHAGVDLFALDGAGRVIWGQATHAPVHAVADGVVVFIKNGGADGHIVIVEHRLTDGSDVYSVYWHVDHVQVREGQPVTRGQIIAVIFDKGLNSHLHWEMRTFRDGRELFPEGTAGARGRCNGYVHGVGYTWDDDLENARPEAYGYLDPKTFVRSHTTP